MTTTEKTLPARKQDPHRAGFHKALALRALYHYRDNLNEAQELGADVSGLIQSLPSFEAITREYNETLDEWAPETLFSDSETEMVAIELVVEILRYEAQPMFGDRVSPMDPFWAMHILESLSVAANHRGYERVRMESAVEAAAERLGLGGHKAEGDAK